MVCSLGKFGKAVIQAEDNYRWFETVCYFHI